MSKKDKKLDSREEVIKSTLERLIRHSKEGIQMIEKVEECYGFMGQVSTDENLSEEFKKEIENRNKMKEDLRKNLDEYLKMYRERFGEYKENE